jgi:hypothetical protein
MNSLKSRGAAREGPHAAMEKQLGPPAARGRAAAGSPAIGNFAAGRLLVLLDLGVRLGAIS